MHIKHRELEMARVNPSNFSKYLENQGVMRSGKFRELQFSIREYHRRGLNSARTRLQQGLSRFVSTTEKDYENFEEKLIAYTKEFEELGGDIHFVGKRDQLGINLQYDIGKGHELRGEISRIDTLPDGQYRVVLFVTDLLGWTDELRFPVLQEIWAKKLDVDVDKITVGIYDLEYNGHSLRKYSEGELKEAMAELDSIASRLA